MGGVDRHPNNNSSNNHPTSHCDSIQTSTREAERKRPIKRRQTRTNPGPIITILIPNRAEALLLVNEGDAIIVLVEIIMTERVVVPMTCTLGRIISRFTGNEMQTTTATMRIMIKLRHLHRGKKPLPFRRILFVLCLPSNCRAHGQIQLLCGTIWPIHTQKMQYHSIVTPKQRPFPPWRAREI